MSFNTANPIILVVDDSPDSVVMLNTALQQGGFTVLVALDGVQALDILKQITPQVILMDANMPNMDGFECCESIRKDFPLLPVIFMTGLTESEHIIKAFNSGGTDYITKPVDPSELIARIQSHTSNANLISEARAALDYAKQNVLSVNQDGDILWATPETSELLQQYNFKINENPSVLSQTIKTWLNSEQKSSDLFIKTESTPIKIRYFKAINQQEHLLKVLGQGLNFDANILEQSLPITKRESEVLLWVAHGKTNKEIGEILSLSPRTINKHLEQLYQKIHVENRASATSVAIQALMGV